MNIFTNKFETLNQQIKFLKEEFENYIADTSQPLDDRWETFMSAPSSLRNHGPWIERFLGLPEDFVGYDCPVYAERHSTVDVDHVVDVIMDIEDYDVDPQEVNLEEFKEDVLARNLYSFTFDW